MSPVQGDHTRSESALPTSVISSLKVVSSVLEMVPTKESYTESV